MSRSLEIQPAIDYLQVIRDTSNEAKRLAGDRILRIEFGGLDNINTLVTFQQGWLVLLSERGEKKHIVPVENTGFPSLPTMLADARAAIKTYEEILQPKTKAIREILQDFAWANAGSLTTHAAERTRVLSGTTSFATIMQTTDKNDRKEALATISFWNSKEKNPPEKTTVIYEEKGLLVAQYFDSDGKWKEPDGFKFVVIDKDAPAEWHPFFIMFTVEGIFFIKGEHDFHASKIIPDRSEGEKDKNVGSSSKNEVDLRLSHFISRQPPDPFNIFLLSYNPLANPGDNQTIFATLLEVSDVVIELRNCAQHIEEVTEAEKLTDLQRRLAAVLKKIEVIPPDAAKLMKGTIAEVSNRIFQEISSKHSV